MWIFLFCRNWAYFLFIFGRTVGIKQIELVTQLYEYQSKSEAIDYWMFRALIIDNSHDKVTNVYSSYLDTRWLL